MTDLNESKSRDVANDGQANSSDGAGLAVGGVLTSSSFTKYGRYFETTGSAVAAKLANCAAAGTTALFSAFGHAKAGSSLAEGPLEFSALFKVRFRAPATATVEESILARHSPLLLRLVEAQ